ncbi:Two component system response regulator receiver and adenyl cyclase domains-containing protein [Desulfonema limicola]|uniref:Two component system response regulator receiver and adenyl cyclase domains-containing protein n=1 Tax=Desulfonema limicola TaxID=45656 RepID=A0A975B5T4_9BACT|nr:adenylate/guanylate cyclase domain-containing protein [Desulfonema limicola]QTA79310.1 Two component system response regulator receiver and adenyl cyclase domains-containing protein [Desulfonema limicola]
MENKKYRIVVVDDEPNNLNLIQQTLQGLYLLSFANRGTKALEVIAKIAPDLILLDIMMPEMDGYEVCKRLKADDKTKNIPVVFISAMGDAGDETKGFDLGAADYITKPFSPPVVKARIRSILALKEKNEQLAQLSKRLSRYLSPQVYELIFSGQRDVLIESQRKKLTVFFSDIVNFTSTAESMEPEDLTTVLNTYLNEMAEIAIKHGGTIDKFVGDAVMVFFGDPKTKGIQEDAMACVSMAIEMVEKLKILQTQWQKSGILHPFQVRIGINTGYCTVGNFGSKSKMDYTIIGGQVNAAKRLEESAMQGQIIISHETWSYVKDNIYCIKKSPISVKGISKPVQTYQVIGYYDQLEKGSRDIAVGNFIEQANVILPEVLVRDINLGRRLEDGFDAIVVAQNDSPMGLLMSYNLNRLLNSHSCRAQFFEQPVKKVMDTSPLLMESYVPISEVAQQAMMRSSNKIYDPVIVTEKGKLIGIAPIHLLIAKLLEH